MRFERLKPSVPRLAESAAMPSPWNQGPESPATANGEDQPKVVLAGKGGLRIVGFFQGAAGVAATTRAAAHAAALRRDGVRMSLDSIICERGLAVITPGGRLRRACRWRRACGRST